MTPQAVGTLTFALLWAFGTLVGTMRRPGPLVRLGVSLALVPVVVGGFVVLAGAGVVMW